jgi:hypothetical protein
MFVPHAARPPTTIARTREGLDLPPSQMCCFLIGKAGLFDSDTTSLRVIMGWRLKNTFVIDFLS